MKKRVIIIAVMLATSLMIMSGCSISGDGDLSGHPNSEVESNANNSENGSNSGDVNVGGSQNQDSQNQDSQNQDSQNQDSNKDSETNNNAQVIVVGKDALPYTQSTIYNQLFDINNHIEIDIDIDEEQIAQIQKDYDKYANMGSKSPIYREAALNITITTAETSYTYHIPNVGVRMKGNTSRTSFYSNRDGQYNLIHLRVKFMDGDFATLESLELKWNRNDDMTYVREIYAYDMYRDMGVLAPHVTLASTDFGDVHQGVFYVYEPVDKNFIEKYVDKDNQEGDLYKCAWTRNGASLTMECSIGIEDEEAVQFYNYDLKTNKKLSEHKQMKNLITVLNQSNVTQKELEKVVDIDNFLAFAAVSYFVGSPDDVRNNYNNHYIYFLKSSGKAVFIPYDCDRVLGVTYG